jgi:hypothetical protein
MLVQYYPLNNGRAYDAREKIKFDLSTVSANAR